MRENMTMRDWIAVPFLFLGGWFISLAAIIGGKEMTDIINEVFEEPI